MWRRSTTSLSGALAIGLPLFTGRAEADAD
jgi:hypothetical protein